MTERAPVKIGEVDLASVITDRPPPVRPPPNPALEAPPIPDLTPRGPVVRMKTFSHVAEWTPPPMPERNRQPVELEEIEWLLEGSLGPADDREQFPTRPGALDRMVWLVALSVSLGVIAAAALWIATA